MVMIRSSFFFLSLCCKKREQRKTKKKKNFIQQMAFLYEEKELRILEASVERAKG